MLVAIRSLVSALATPAWSEAGSARRTVLTNRAGPLPQASPRKTVIFRANDGQFEAGNILLKRELANFHLFVTLHALLIYLWL